MLHNLAQSMERTGFMSDIRAVPTSLNRLDRLRKFLAQDPNNIRLIQDAAEVAYELSDLAEAQALLDRLAALGPLGEEQTNLAGLVALRQGRYDDAIRHFADLRDSRVPGSAIRFNLAWASAMAKRREEALALLDDATLKVSQEGPWLKIQLLHHLGQLDEGLALGKHLSVDHAHDARLMGALAIMALDAGDLAQARAYAVAARDDLNGIATLGLLRLGEGDTAAADECFAHGLAQRGDNPRLWIGRGLSLLEQGQTEEAARDLEKGAGLFETHTGTWIASGWARFAAGDEVAARAHFQRALALDPNFAEAHGGLAVLSILAGDIEQGRQGAQIAIRLDRRALGAQLAQILLLEQRGETRAAETLRRTALNMPVGPDGLTIGEAIARLSLRRG